MANYDVRKANEFRHDEAALQMKELILFYLGEEGFLTKEDWWNEIIWPRILELIAEKRLRFEVAGKK